MESTTKTSDQLATLEGQKTVSVALRDGMREIVTVQALPVRKFPKLMELMDDEPGKIELATGKETGWADNLTSQSHADLLAVVEDLNSADFFAWLRRRVQRSEQLVPGSVGEIGKALLSHSPTGSQTARSAVA